MLSIILYCINKLSVLYWQLVIVCLCCMPFVMDIFYLFQDLLISHIILSLRTFCFQIHPYNNKRGTFGVLVILKIVSQVGIFEIICFHGSLVLYDQAVVFNYAFLVTPNVVIDFALTLEIWNVHSFGLCIEVCCIEVCVVNLSIKQEIGHYGVSSKIIEEKSIYIIY
ncbi:hypothetical protein ACJX0J_014455, partial [Zea mays]